MELKNISLFGAGASGVAASSSVRPAARNPGQSGTQSNNGPPPHDAVVSALQVLPREAKPLKMFMGTIGESQRFHSKSD